MINEGADIHCKEVATKVFTVLLVELCTSIEKPKGYLEAPPYIRQPSITLTSKNPVIRSYLLSSFLSSTLEPQL